MVLGLVLLMLCFMSPVLSGETENDSYLVLPPLYNQNESKQPNILHKEESRKPDGFPLNNDQNSDLDPALLQYILESLKNHFENNISLKNQNAKKLESRDSTNSMEREELKLNKELLSASKSSPKQNRVCKTCQDAKVFDILDNLLKFLEKNNNYDPDLLQYILKFLKKYLKNKIQLKQLESHNFIDSNEREDNIGIDTDYLRQPRDPTVKSNKKLVLKFEFENPSRPECKDAVMNLLRDVFYAYIKLSRNSPCSQHSKFTINDVPVFHYEINIKKHRPEETKPAKVPYYTVPYHKKLNDVATGDDFAHYLQNYAPSDLEEASPDRLPLINVLNQYFQDPTSSVDKTTENPLLMELHDLINDLDPNSNVGKYPINGRVKNKAVFALPLEKSKLPYDIRELLNNPKSNTKANKFNPGELHNLFYKLFYDNQNRNKQLLKPFSKNDNDFDPTDHKPEKMNGDVSDPNDLTIFPINIIKPQDRDDNNRNPTLVEIQQLLNSLPNLDTNMALSPKQKLNNDVKNPKPNNVNNKDLPDLDAIIHQLYPNEKDVNPKHQNYLDLKDPVKASLNPDFSEQMNVNSGPLLKYGPYVKYKNLSDLQKWLGVSDLYKLNSLPNKAGLIELTYMLKQPMPLIYQPIYFVKYTLPYATFLHNLKELLTLKPYLRSNVSRLYQELISKSNITEVSPDLKNYKKQDILKLVSNNGTLVRARLLSSSDMFLNEQLKVIRDLNANLQSDLDESDDGDLKHIYNNIAYLKKVAPNSTKQNSKYIKTLNFDFIKNFLKEYNPKALDHLLAASAQKNQFNNPKTQKNVFNQLKLFNDNVNSRPTRTLDLIDIKQVDGQDDSQTEAEPKEQ